MAEPRAQVGRCGDLTVASECLPGATSIALEVWIDAGSRDELVDAAGYAHLIEHMLFKGGPERNARAISDFFDAIGTDANASTSREATILSARFVPRHLDAVLDVFGEMLGQPAFREADLEREREVVLEEIAMYLDSPADVAFEVADGLAFPGHPLARPVLGRPDSIAAATPESVQRHHSAWYGSGAMVIAAAGAISQEQLVAAVERAFVPRLQADTATRAARHAPAAVASEPGQVRIQAVGRPAEQVHIAVAAPGVPVGDPRRYALMLLDALAGGMNGSRLFDRIREREGLAYSVYTWTSLLADTGQLGAYLGVRPDRLEPALRLLDEELARLAAGDITPAELTRAQDYLEGRTLLGLESPAARASRLGACLTAGVELLTPAETVARLRAVDVDAVSTMAAAVLAGGWSLAMVAADAQAATDAAMRALGADRVVLVEPADDSLTSHGKEGQSWPTPVPGSSSAAQRA